MGGANPHTSGCHRPFPYSGPISPVFPPFAATALPPPSQARKLDSMTAQRGFPAVLLAALLFPIPLPAANPIVWKKVRYEGGTVDARVNRFDWNTTVSAAPGLLELRFGGQKTLRIATSAVTRLSYGQKAYSRVAGMATLSVFLTPAALFGVLPKSRDHTVAIEFTDGGKPGAVLLMVHKDNYRDLLLTLATLTGKTVENWP